MANLHGMLKSISLQLNPSEVLHYDQDDTTFIFSVNTGDKALVTIDPHDFEARFDRPGWLYVSNARFNRRTVVALIVHPQARSKAKRNSVKDLTDHLARVQSN